MKLLTAIASSLVLAGMVSAAVAAEPSQAPSPTPVPHAKQPSEQKGTAPAAPEQKEQTPAPTQPGQVAPQQNEAGK